MHPRADEQRNACEARSETVEATARDKQHDERGCGADDDGTGERLEAADAVAEPPLHCDLNRPAEPGDECE